jgi:hypothetical protein
MVAREPKVDSARWTWCLLLLGAAAIGMLVPSAATARAAVSPNDTRRAVHPSTASRCKVRSDRHMIGLVRRRFRRAIDRDRDGLRNRPERRRYGTRPGRRDTDRDRLTDGFEVRCSRTTPTRRDTDKDGLRDGTEIAMSLNPSKADSDGDGLLDRAELVAGTDPHRPDSDADGLSDGDEARARTDPAAPDTDQDGIRDGPEVHSHKTDPRRPDTDGDQLWDGDELQIGENPRHPTTASRVIYVSPAGNDQSAGSKQHPLADLNALAAALSGGELVVLEPGQYAPIVDRARRSHNTRIVGLTGAAHTLPVIPGYQSWGGSNLTIRRVSFTGPVLITDDPFHRGPDYASSDISLTDNDFSYPDGTCLTVRSGAHDISIRSNHITHCKTGIGGPNTGPDPRLDSYRISIVKNVLRNFSVDGIQFGRWSHVLITQNDIGHMSDPVNHNDGIQFTGGTTDAAITRNHLHDSEHGQLLFIQPAFGPIDDVLVENNLINAAAGYAVQSQAATHVRFINNTIWHSGYGGLLLRGYDDAAATDTLVVNNILYGYGYAEGAAAALETRNIIRTRDGASIPPGNISISLQADPGFADAAGLDFHLRPDSIANGAGSPVYAPPNDLGGKARSTTSPSIGAFE